MVNVPAGLDVEHLAEIGLEVAGMNPTQAHDFLQHGRLEIDADA